MERYQIKREQRKGATVVPKRVSRSKRMLQGIVQRYRARVENSPKTRGPLDKQHLSTDELLAFSEAHYAEMMLANREKD